MIKSVIFDFDGTIANTLPLCITAFRKAIEPLAKRQLSDAEIIATFGPSEEGTINAFIPQYYDEGVASYLEYYRMLHGMCPKPFEGVVEVMRWLKSKNRIVTLVTGKGKKSCDLSLAYYGMGDCFDLIETGSPAGERKADGIHAVLSHFNLKPDEAVYIGDTVSDIVSCEKAGVPILSAAWASTADMKALEERNPENLFRTVDSLRRYLEQAIG